MCSVSVYKEPESTKVRARVMGKSKVEKVTLTKPSYGLKLKVEIASPLKLLTHLKQCHHQKFFFKFSWDNYLVSRKVSVFYHIFSVFKSGMLKVTSRNILLFLRRDRIVSWYLVSFFKESLFCALQACEFLVFTGMTVVERCLLKCVSWYSWERVRIDGAY